MAGGEGTRLRPMTANQPKPMLPVANRPIMEHVLRLLKRHGFDETIITVQFLAAIIRNYFGDGEEFGMSLQYATEELPLGTAGSVRNAEDALRDETFLVISGDALTDMDLTAMVNFHKNKGALVTVGLARIPNPLEFGIVITREDGRIQRFLNKPTWGQVFSDIVNTGVYVMEPEVLAEVPPGEVVDWSGDVFPELVKRDAPLYGYISDGYWEDVGTHESYLKAQADVLARRVALDIAGVEVSPGIWVAEGAEVDADAVLAGPLCIGDYAKIEADAHLREYTVIGSNVVVKKGAFLHRAVVHNNVYIAEGVTLRGCVVGKNTDVMRRASIEEAAVVGDECVIEPEAYLSAGVKVYPFKTIEAGAVVNTSVIWESRGQRTLFGPRGVSGLINVEVTPELAVRLASAYASTLKKGSSVLTSCDASQAAHSLKFAVIGALTSSGLYVHDLDTCPLPVARLETAHAECSGGIVLCTSPGNSASIDIVFLDADGADLPSAAQRKLERVFSRQEFRRAFQREIGNVVFPTRAFDVYVKELTSSLDMTTLTNHRIKTIADCAGGSVGMILPGVLDKTGAEAITVDDHPDAASTTETLGQIRKAMDHLADLVTSSGAAFGVRFDRVGEEIHLVDERGVIISDERAMLVMLDLVSDERRTGKIVVPVTASRVAEQICQSYGVAVERTATSQDELTRSASDPEVILAGDGHGGFLIPEFSVTRDGVAAFVRLLGLLARCGLTLSEVDARIPTAHLLRRSMPTPWAMKSKVMRTVMETAGDNEIDTTDGVRVMDSDRGWVLVLPDPLDAVINIWAEGKDADETRKLLDKWCAVVEKAGRG